MRLRKVTTQVTCVNTQFGGDDAPSSAGLHAKPVFDQGAQGCTVHRSAWVSGTPPQESASSDVETYTAGLHHTLPIRNKTSATEDIKAVRRT